MRYYANDAASFCNIFYLILLQQLFYFILHVWMALTYCIHPLQFTLMSQLIAYQVRLRFYVTKYSQLNDTTFDTDA